MHHKVGIWIDHKKAVIVSASADRVTATTVESRVGPHARYSGRAGYPTPAGPQEGRGEKKYEDGNVLNLLKRTFQKRFLAQQCKELTNCLADAITTTWKPRPFVWASATSTTARPHEPLVPRRRRGRRRCSGNGKDLQAVPLLPENGS